MNPITQIQIVCFFVEGAHKPDGEEGGGQAKGGGSHEGFHPFENCENNYQSKDLIKVSFKISKCFIYKQ